jgi:hypothetical protein
MFYKGGADKDLFSHISATYSLKAFFGLSLQQLAISQKLILSSQPRLRRVPAESFWSPFLSES